MTSYLTKKDIATHFFGFENYIPGSSTTKNLGIKISSGTTDIPSIVIVQNHIAEGKYVHCLEIDRFAAYMRFGTKRATYLNDANFILRNTSAKRMLFLDRKDVEHQFFYDRILEFAPSEMYTYVFNLNFLLDNVFEKCKKISPLKSIQHIGMSGDLVTKQLVEKIKRYIPYALIKIDYGVAEIDSCTISCPYLDKKYPRDRFRVFHPFFLFNFDIIDKDEDGVGEIVITSPELQNYKTGDLGKITSENCKCGFKKTLFYKGRKDYDIVHCAGATFLSSEIEKIFATFSHLVLDYMIEVGETEKDNKTVGYVVCNLALQNLSVSIQKNILEHLARQLFVTKTQTLQKLIDKNFFLPVAYKTMKPREQISKKIRLKKIIS
ncbi:MAG: hypothetical protein Q8R36_02885 [bacterium]|nr:hypothetical protein [bacterium]